MRGRRLDGGADSRKTAGHASGASRQTFRARRERERLTGLVGCSRNPQPEADVSVIASLKPYPKMKDSGVTWMGEVPAHWDMRRLKQICSRSALYGANIPAESYTDDGIRFLRTTDITDDGGLNAGGVFVRDGLVRNHLLADGDLLLSRSGTIGRSFLYEREKHGACAYAGYLVRFVFNADAVPGYVFWFTKTRAFSDFVRLTAISSTIENLNGEKYANCPLPIPPISEQAAIARFLDRAVLRIQRYVAAKKKLLALLDEQKQTMISQVITGQIDVRTGAPYSAYKPSGIPWLGEVPSHWFVAPLKRYCHFRGGTGFPISAQGIADEDVIFAKVSDMNREGNERSLWTAANSLSRDAVRSLGANIFGPNSIVFPKVGGALLTNKRRVIVRDTCIDNNLMGCTVTGADPGYVFHLLSCIDLGGLAKPGPVPAVSERDVREIRVTVPPHREQMDIARFLEDRLSALVKRRAGAVRQVEFVSEYRDRLVADLVTGKLDARWGVHAQPKSDHGVS